MIRKINRPAWKYWPNRGRHLPIEGDNFSLCFVCLFVNTITQKAVCRTVSITVIGVTQTVTQRSSSVRLNNKGSLRQRMIGSQVHCCNMRERERERENE